MSRLTGAGPEPSPVIADGGASLVPVLEAGGAQSRLHQIPVWGELCLPRPTDSAPWWCPCVGMVRGAPGAPGSRQVPLGRAEPWDLSAAQRRPCCPTTLGVRFRHWSWGHRDRAQQQCSHRPGCGLSPRGRCTQAVRVGAVRSQGHKLPVCPVPVTGPGQPASECRGPSREDGHGPAGARRPRELPSSPMEQEPRPVR